MTKFNYQPLFDYLSSKDITAVTLVRDGIVAEGVIHRMKHQMNIETASICRIMDYLEITDVSKVFKVVEVKDDDSVKIHRNMTFNGK